MLMRKLKSLGSPEPRNNSKFSAIIDRIKPVTSRGLVLVPLFWSCLMRQSVYLTVFVLAAMFGSAPAASQPISDYPNKPIRLVVPFPAGGVVDFFARLVAQKMSERMGQPVVVDNRAGAAGIIGFEHVAKAAPDGYTLVMGSTGTAAINPALYRKLPYDVKRDFVAATLIGTGPVLIAVHPSVPAKSIRELIALAKAKPGQLNYGSAGSGSTSHLSAELFQLMAGVKLAHIPYKGSAPGITALVAGEISVYIENVPVFIPHLQTGRIRALGVSGDVRYPALPDVPTVAEGGLKGYDAAGWWGLFAPAGTPKGVLDRLHTEISAIVALSDVRERMVAQGALPSDIGGEQLAAFLAAEQMKWARVVQESGARID